jgi:sterol desaturase/sphingolipid hydroxylase (fatty acid hydroxylase superfamily)
MFLPLYSIPAIAVFLWIARLYEKRLPAQSVSTTDMILDWKLAGTRSGLDQLILPMANASGIILVNAAGGGWIHLRSDGWWFLLSVMLFFLVSDFWGWTERLRRGGARYR